MYILSLSYNHYSTKCVERKTSEEHCARNLECIKILVCVKNKCQCSSFLNNKRYWSINEKKCVDEPYNFLNFKLIIKKTTLLIKNL